MWRSLVLVLVLASGADVSAAPLDDGIAAYTARDPQRALDILRPVAEQGVADAQYFVGRIYFDNPGGVARDPAEALRWFRLSGEQGHPIAQYHVGAIYRNGIGVERNDTEAAKWIRQAADQHYDLAQNVIGEIYRDGRGVSRDLTEAKRWFQLAADQSQAVAEYNLGRLYLNGQGVARDEAEAARYLERSAGHGYAPARNELAALTQRAAPAAGAAIQANPPVTAQMMSSRLDGIRAAEAGDGPRALSILTTVADAGDMDAQYFVGRVHGDGNRAGVPMNQPEMVKWFRLAAQQGHVIAQYRLGIALQGGTGVTRNETEGATWLRRSADQQYAPAQNAIGQAYRDARGVTRDYAEAQKWFRLSAGQDFAMAQYNLGILYGNAQGVPRDDAEAVRWYQLAAAQGHAPAAADLAALARQGIGPGPAAAPGNGPAATETAQANAASAKERSDQLMARQTFQFPLGEWLLQDVTTQDGTGLYLTIYTLAHAAAVGQVYYGVAKGDFIFGDLVGVNAQADWLNRNFASIGTVSGRQLELVTNGLGGTRLAFLKGKQGQNCAFLITLLGERDQVMGALCGAPTLPEGDFQATVRRFVGGLKRVS